MLDILLFGALGTWGWILTIVIVAVIGFPVSGYIGFLIAKKMVQKELKENPVISEKQIRAMFMAMGRKPSEADIRKVMNSIKQQK